MAMSLESRGISDRAACKASRTERSSLSAAAHCPFSSAPAALASALETLNEKWVYADSCG